MTKFKTRIILLYTPIRGYKITRGDDKKWKIQKTGPQGFIEQALRKGEGLRYQVRDEILTNPDVLNALREIKHQMALKDPTRFQEFQAGLDDFCKMMKMRYKSEKAEVHSYQSLATVYEVLFAVLTDRQSQG